MKDEKMCREKANFTEKNIILLYLYFWILGSVTINRATGINNRLHFCTNAINERINIFILHTD